MIAKVNQNKNYKKNILIGKNQDSAQKTEDNINKDAVDVKLETFVANIKALKMIKRQLENFNLNLKENPQNESHLKFLHSQLKESLNNLQSDLAKDVEKLFPKKDANDTFERMENLEDITLCNNYNEEDDLEILDKDENMRKNKIYQDSLNDDEGGSNEGVFKRKIKNASNNAILNELKEILKGKCETLDYQTIDLTDKNEKKKFQSVYSEEKITFRLPTLNLPIKRIETIMEEN